MKRREFITLFGGTAVTPTLRPLVARAAEDSIQSKHIERHMWPMFVGYTGIAHNVTSSRISSIVQVFGRRQ